MSKLTNVTSLKQHSALNTPSISKTLRVRISGGRILQMVNVDGVIYAREKGSSYVYPVCQVDSVA